MERPNARGANNFVIGLFVSVSVLVGAGFVVFMGGSTSIRGEAKIKTFFNDVRGLNVGAPVFFSGIQVGRVSGFQFPTTEEVRLMDIPNGVVTVISIFREHRERIKADSEAMITTQGVLGDKVVVISAGTPEASVLSEQKFLQSQRPKELADYLVQGGNVVDNLNHVAVGLNALVNQLNGDGKISGILANLEKTTQNMASVTKGLNDGKGSLGGLLQGGANDDLGPALKSLRRVMDKIDKGQGTLGALVNDSSLHEDLRVLLGGAKRSQVVRFLIRQAIQAQDDKQIKEAAPAGPKK